MLERVSELSYPFVRLSNIPLHVYATFFIVVQTQHEIYTHNKILNTAIVVQSLSQVQLFSTAWTACSTRSLAVLHYLLEFAQTHVH